MTFFNELQERTAPARDYLLAAPIVSRTFAGDVTCEDYVAFLCQAYHHVRHTTPLLMAAGSRVPVTREWMRKAFAEYIQEEIGHEEWVLNDIAACGYDKERVRTSRPNASTELMVAYAYDMVTRINPIGMFGMVHVLEGTSTNLADFAADCIQNALGLPNRAFSYLRSHGKLDQEHVAFFESIVNKIDDRDEQELIVHSADMFYRLYGNVYREIAAEQAVPLAA